MGLPTIFLLSDGLKKLNNVFKKIILSPQDNKVNVLKGHYNNINSENCNQV